MFTLTDEKGIESTPELTPEDVRRVAASVAQVHALPGVATTDWCQRAASALGTLWEGTSVGVGIGAFGAETGTGRVELSHVRVAGTSPERRRGFDGRAIQRRVRAALEHVHWNGTDTAAIGLRWTPDSIGSPWQDLGIDELVVGIGRLGGVDGATRSSRFLLVEMSVVLPPRREAEAAMLGAVMGVLLGRCRMGFVPGPVDASRRVTASEQVILEQLVLGRSVREIAEMLERSPHTVHDHVKSLHRKLRARSRGELIARALGHLGGVDVEHRTQSPVVVRGSAFATGQ